MSTSAQSAAHSNVNDLIESVRWLSIDSDLADSISGLVEALGSRIDWQAFGTVPHINTYGYAATGTIKRIRGKLHEGFDSYRFLTDSPLQNIYLQDLTASVGSERVQVFSFLCLGAAQPISKVELWIGGARVADLLDRHVLVQNRNTVQLAVSVMPYRQGYYLIDLPIVEQYGTKAGLPPAHISPQSDWAVQWIRRKARTAKIDRLLEMGSGIGIVLIEARSYARERVGVEVGARNFAFSLVNKQLANDDSVTFMQGDLFSAVTGKFDLILFNPWQPTVHSLPLVERFLSEAPSYLTDRGEIALWVQTGGSPDHEDPVLKVVMSAARQQGRVVSREILESFSCITDGRHRVGMVASLLLSLGGKVGRDSPLSTHGLTLGWRLRRGHAWLKNLRRN